VTFRRAGFTLVEALIVISIIGILIGLLLPAIQASREAAARTKCSNSLRQIGIALHHHHDTHGVLPPALPRNPPANDPGLLLHWPALILPFIEQGPLWETSQAACRADVVTVHNPPHVANSVVIDLYVCGSDSRLRTPHVFPSGEPVAFTSYVGVAGSPNGQMIRRDDGVLLRGPKPGMLASVIGVQGVPFSKVTDGLSQTLLVGERPPPRSGQAGRWYSKLTHDAVVYPGPDGALIIPSRPIYLEEGCVLSGRGFGPGRLDNPCDRYHFWSLHPGGSNFLFGDTSVRFMPYSAHPIMESLATISGGESVELP
jgi:prepilin-type N-terminal cleavage/methylation domain-containing protein/prepilin-type processing-associated H-X9-DG protein